MRQPHVTNKLVVVAVKYVGGGKANDCSNNALDLAEQQDGIRPITGWLVCHSPNENDFEVIQHWWNTDADGNHFDVTPDLGFRAEYVVDLELYKFAFKNQDKIDSIVASSLQIKSNKITAVDEELGVGRRRFYRTLDTLDNHSLYNVPRD